MVIGDIILKVRDYLNWAEGYPQPGSGQLCAVAITESGKRGQWVNRDCSHSFSYVCKTTGG